MKLIVAAHASIKGAGVAGYGGLSSNASKPLSERKGSEMGTFDL
jgi:hypothetical protein